MAYRGKNVPGYTNLGDIIHTFKIEIGDYGMNNYRQYISLAARCFVDINIQDLKQIEVDYPTINTDLNTAPLRDDFVTEFKIGLNVNERIYILPKNRNIVLPRIEDCGEESRDVAASNSNTTGFTSDNTGSSFYPHFRNNRWVNNLYGAYGGYADVYYRIDIRNNRIVLEGNVPAGASLIVEYVGTGLRTTDTTVIPIYAKEAILAFLRWKVEDNKPTAAEATISRYMMIYNEERKRIIRYKHQFTLQDLFEAQRQSASQGIKRN